MSKRLKPDNLDFQMVVDSVGLGIFTVDTEWNITFFNEEAERITGFSREEALGQKCWDIFYTKYCNKFCYLQKAIDTQKHVHRESLTVLNKKNRPVPVEITAAVLLNEQGDVVGGVESFLDVSDKAALEKEVKQSYSFGDFIGRDVKIQRMFDVLTMAAASQAPILLLGETGTGKDLLARSTHNASLRSKGPFVKINCAALPENLLESELFGYKKGAFTDARADKPGMLLLANKGTLFLDEIGDMPLSLQAKLLQALEEKQFFPLGATHSQSVDIRIIAATNRNLAALVEAGGFRSDLYYRLRVLEVKIPPLRERACDIPVLLKHFVESISGRYNKRITDVDSEAMHALLNYTYPGNVREMMHVVEHAVILARHEEIGLMHLPETVRAKEVPPEFLEASPTPSRGSMPGSTTPITSSHSPRSLQDRERDFLLESLEANDWNVSKTARSINVNRTTLWRKMKKFGL